MKGRNEALLGVRTAMGVILLLGSASMVSAAQNPQAASVRPAVESLGALREAYERAIQQARATRSTPGLPLPEGFVATSGPNTLPPRLVELGKTYAARPLPRTPDGRPDLNGQWASQNAMIFGVAASNSPRSAYAPVDLALALEIPDMRLAAAERLVPSNVPSFKPEAATKVRDLYSQRVTTDSTAECGWAGLPRIGAPTYIAQSGSSFIFTYNDPNGSAWRIIDMKRTSFPEDADSTFVGTSVAHWDKDTLVVETQYLPRETWFGEYGYYHGRDMKITERFHRSGDIMTYQVTVDDPSVLTQPWTRDAITLFHMGSGKAESIIQPCTPSAADASKGETVLFVTRLY